jgi:16S rRNA (adenine1518-N6/adenine1519-N6)-dimethyltransferase
VEPRLARRIVDLAEVGPGVRVLEIGAGLGSLTVELARAGADVLAVEVDRTLLPALAEAVASFATVRVQILDAANADWSIVLGGPGPWRVVANLPYNVAVPVVMRILEGEPRVDRMLVMVQREVGERLAAGPGDPQYGGVSVRVAYRAEARVIRRVPPTVFWPRPNVASVLVSLVRRPPPEGADPAVLWRVIEIAFAQRRKTMRNAALRLGLDPLLAIRVLESCGIAPGARPEELGLESFVRVAGALGST